MQVTCPKCRGLADRIYDPPLLRYIHCHHCGYKETEVNAKEASKILDILERESLEQKLRDLMDFHEAVVKAANDYHEEWLRQNQGICTPIWAGPIPKDKIPPEGYWRIPGTLREWLKILGVRDIDAAEKKVRKAGPFNRWEEIAWDLWRKGEI